MHDLGCSVCSRCFPEHWKDKTTFLRYDALLQLSRAELNTYLATGVIPPTSAFDKAAPLLEPCPSCPVTPPQIPHRLQSIISYWRQTIRYCNLSTEMQMHMPQRKRNTSRTSLSPPPQVCTSSSQFLVTKHRNSSELDRRLHAYLDETSFYGLNLSAIRTYTSGVKRVSFASFISQVKSLFTFSSEAAAKQTISPWKTLLAQC